MVHAEFKVTRLIRPHKGGRDRATGRIDVVVRQSVREGFLAFCRRMGMSQADAIEMAIAWLVDSQPTAGYDPTPGDVDGNDPE